MFCRWCLSLRSGGVLVYNPFSVMPLRPWCQGHTTLRKQADKYSSSSVFWNVWWMVDIMFSFLIKCSVEFISEVFGCGVFLRRAFISGSLSLTNWRPLNFFFFLGQFWYACFVRNLPFFQLVKIFLLATILTVSTKIFLWEMFIIVHSKISSYFPCDFFFDHELNSTFIFSPFLKNGLSGRRFPSREGAFLPTL